MKLKCKINGVEYPIVDGATFSEEYNETLDSGEIIISQVGKIDIKPFDDVFIYDGEFNGFNVPMKRVDIETKSEVEDIITFETKDYRPHTGTIENANYYKITAMRMWADFYFNYTADDEEDADYIFSYYKVRATFTKPGGTTQVVTMTANYKHGVSNTINFGNSPYIGFITATFNPADNNSLRFDYGQTTYTEQTGQTWTLTAIQNNVLGLNTYQERKVSQKFTLSMRSGLSHSRQNWLNQTFTIRYNGNETKNYSLSSNPGSYTYFLTNTSEKTHLPLVLTFTRDIVTGFYKADFVNTDTYSNVKSAVLETAKYELKLSETPKPAFYKHLLIDSFTEERLNLTENLYKYKISMFSETKGLERIQLPNISITQPLKTTKKISIWTYLKQYVNLYSPKVKYITNSDTKTWAYLNKYSLDESLESIFKSTFSPDFSLNNPSLRDVLTQLMIVKDLIPYVDNNVIKAIDITKRVGTFEDNPNFVNYVIGSMSSDNYTQNLKRNYNQSLSQENSTSMIEYLGFRNSDTALLTIEDLRIETRFPIYKVNRVLMCYYKKVYVTPPGSGTAQTKMMLCKQDISELVKLNSERNLLSQDWNDFGSSGSISGIDSIKNYKMATVGYDVGSKFITGWGTKYSYPQGWWNIEKTYVENIVDLVDQWTPYGINTYGYVKESSQQGGSISPPANWGDGIISPFSNASLKLKSLFFIVEYDGFYNGTIIHSKDDEAGQLTINDNPSSSLTVLESDGLFQKEKANRLGNKILRINARYSAYAQLQPLGSVFGGEEDIIIFNRQYAIYDKVINCNYTGSKDYVMKNYFNSVYAKHRTHNLLSYDESVIRAENKKMFLLLSRKEAFYEKENRLFTFTGFEDNSFELLSAFNPSPIMSSIDHYDQSKKINAGYFLYQNNFYLSDINAFVSGSSLCFNMSMYDNVSSGVYIDVKEPPYNPVYYPNNTFLGSIQKWHIMTDDIETGFISNIGAYVCHFDQSDVFNDKVIDYNATVVSNLYDDILLKLPLATVSLNQTSNVIGDVYTIRKDNKEVLDFTFQFEPITTDNNVMFSHWLMKLSDLISNYNKVDEDYSVTETQGTGFNATAHLSTYYYPNNQAMIYPTIQLNISTANLSSLTDDKSVVASFEWTNDGTSYTFYYINLLKIISVTTNVLTIQCRIRAKYDHVWYENTINIPFQKLGTGTFNGNWLFHDKTSPTGYTSFGYVAREFLRPNGTTFPIKAHNGFSNGYKDLSNALFRTFYIEEAIVSVSKTYTKNMIVLVNTKPIGKRLVYNEYSSLAGFGGDYSTSIATERLSKYFSVKYTENGLPYIDVDVNTINKGTYKAIEFWYYNKKTASYHFVFGTNTVLLDKNGTPLPQQPVDGHIKIYASLLSIKDQKVYDEKNTLTGIVRNCADDDESYGTMQLYSDII